MFAGFGFQAFLCCVLCLCSDFCCGDPGCFGCFFLAGGLDGCSLDSSETLGVGLCGRDPAGFFFRGNTFGFFGRCAHGELQRLRDQPLLLQPSVLLGHNDFFVQPHNFELLVDQAFGFFFDCDACGFLALRHSTGLGVESLVVQAFGFCFGGDVSQLLSFQARLF